jgi:hypothetical protein
VTDPDSPTVRAVAEALRDVEGLPYPDAATLLLDALAAVPVVARAVVVTLLTPEMLAEALAVEFGKAGFFKPSASMAFLTAQASLMLTSALRSLTGGSDDPAA